MEERGFRETHARTLYSSLFGKFRKGIPNAEWSEASLPALLPKSIKADLARDFTLSSSRVVEQVASDLRYPLLLKLTVTQVRFTISTVTQVN